MAAMKKPIILGVQGHAARLVRDADAGICIEPENAKELVDAVCSLASAPDACLRFGQSGHDHVVRHYDRAVLADQYVDLLESLTDQPHPAITVEPTLPIGEVVTELHDDSPVEKAA
jgi:glycosyltransferase involved in cell wall biosynthesis